MSRFRKLLAIDGKPMLNNSRPVQKLNDRTVFYFTSWHFFYIYFKFWLNIINNNNNIIDDYVNDDDRDRDDDDDDKKKKNGMTSIEGRVRVWKILLLG